MSDPRTPPPKPTRTGIVLGAAIGAAVAAPVATLIFENQLLGLGVGAVLGACIGGMILAPFIGRKRRDERD